MRIIDTYDSEGRVTVGAQSYPACCLIEDDDGIRHLLISSPSVLAPVWVAAHAAGAASLLLVDDTSIRWMRVEEFMDGRTEQRNPPRFDAPEHAWKTWVEHGLPPYRDMAREGLAVAQERLSGEFVHLHAHSEFSPMDGLSKVQEMVKAVADDDQPALAVTDHGVCAAHPTLQKVATAAGIKPIFGVEAYLVDDRFDRTPENLYAYYHLVLWAETQEGLLNIWAASTEANRTGFYLHPRMDWDLLREHSAGVIASTACLRGPLNAHIKKGEEELALMNLAKLQDIYHDRLYAELHTNEVPEQKLVNEVLVAMAQQHSVPLIAVSDSHYPCYADRKTHRVWISAQTNKEIQDEAELFAGETDYHLMQAKEVRQYLSYLDPGVVKEAMDNTVTIAERCNVKVEGKTVTPVFSKKGGAEADVDRVIRLCIENWDKTTGKRFGTEAYEARFEREMKLLISKEFCGYFLMWWDICQWAKSHGILVGPGRGSGGGSLVAYLLNITEIDPVDSELLFERFLTEGRTSLPDFDVDFPQSKREPLTHYVMDRWGEDAVARVGTITRLKNKGVVRDMFRVLKGEIDNLHWPDVDAISKIIEEAEASEAGLGLSWEDLWDQHGEVLEPYKVKYPNIFEYADKLVGRVKSYGKHPAGLIISADGPLSNRIPLRAAGESHDRQMVAEFDMDALEALGFIKFDMLTLRTLDTIQMATDLIRERRDVEVNIYGWKDEYKDPQIWDSISDGHTLGIFQIETRSGTKLTKRFRPQNLNELADVITLVRPGPVRSGLTETYFRRRGGEPVTFPDPRLESVLAKTYGCILYQEDVMQTCMVLGGYDENEADTVRRILGKKKVKEVQAEGEKFIQAVVERGMAQGDTETLWAQMAEFAKYSFNRAHAFGYAVLGYWTAWLKFHYPIEFLTAALSTVDKNRIPEFINEARRMGYRVMPPDINESGEGFRAGQMAVRYGLDSIKGVGEAAVNAITAGQPYTSWEDFLERKGSTNMGVVRILASVGAFDSLVPDRKALERKLEWESNGEADRCQHKDETVVKDHGLPCTFDWSSEPVELTAKGKPKKPKPPPKRCTKGCRNFTAPILNTSDLQPYSAKEIRDREMELLGVYLSSTPFDRIPPEVMDEMMTADEVDSAPPGDHPVAAIITKVRPHKDRHGKSMGFIELNAQNGVIDVTVFKDAWKVWSRDLRVGTLCLAMLHKTDRINLIRFEPL